MSNKIYLKIAMTSFTHAARGTISLVGIQDE